MNDSDAVDTVALFTISASKGIPQNSLSILGRLHPPPTTDDAQKGAGGDDEAAEALLGDGML